MHLGVVMQVTRRQLADEVLLARKNVHMRCVCEMLYRADRRRLIASKAPARSALTPDTIAVLMLFQAMIKVTGGRTDVDLVVAF